MEYFIDNVPPEKQIDLPVVGTRDYAAGHILTNTDVAADLGMDWINAKRPVDCSVHEVVFPTISATIIDNVVTVEYTKKPVTESPLVNRPSSGHRSSFENQANIII